MPNGKYSFYLHTDGRADVAVMTTTSTISQPLRGEFIRTVATAGPVVYRTDVRLPELILVIFDRQFSIVRLYALMAVVSGACASLRGLPYVLDYGTPAGIHLMRSVNSEGWSHRLPWSVRRWM